MMHQEHILRVRADMERRHMVKVGRGVVKYDAAARAWILPGGMKTTHRPAAERAARIMDRMISGDRA